MKRMLLLGCAGACMALLAFATAAVADERFVDIGRNPDLAVNRQGLIHLVYMQGSQVTYGVYHPEQGFLGRLTVGQSGDAVNSDPHIALDSFDNPHFFWADRGRNVLVYTYLQGGSLKPTSTIPRTCGDCPGIRKPRIAIDQRTNLVYLYYEDRRPYVRVAANGSVSGRILLGSSNNSEEDAGGVAVGADGTVHFTMRKVSGLFYRAASASGNLGPIETAAGDGASDFSAVASDAINGAVPKIAAVQSGKQGDNIRYIVKRDGVFRMTQFGSQFVASENHDGVGPSIAVDRANVSYLTWSGGRDRAWYQIIGNADQLVGGVQPLANVTSEQGGKFTFPEVKASPCGGAWAAWEDDRSGGYSIYLRDINVLTGTCFGKPPIIAAAGWGATSLNATQVFQAIAVVTDPDDAVESVELLINDQSTNIFLNDTGFGGDAIAGDGVWTLQSTLVLPTGSFLLGMRARDAGGNLSEIWPYLTVEGQSALEPEDYPSAEVVNAKLEEAFRVMGISPGPHPRTLVGGYLDSDITGSEGGRIRLIARADGLTQVTRIDMLLGGLPTGVSLYDNGTQGDAVAGDGLFTVTFDGVAAGLPSGRILFELLPVDAFGVSGKPWPYLHVE